MILTLTDLRGSGWAAKGRMPGGEADETCLPWTKDSILMIIDSLMDLC